MTPSHVGVRRLCRSTVLVVITATAAAVGLAAPSYASIESSYLSILNQERASHGLAPLQLNPELTRVAQGWSSHMAASHVLAHNPGLTTQIGNWQAVGENVGDGPDLRDLADAFWASAPHRSNILDRGYTQVGIAAVVSNGMIWITVDFRQPLRAAAPPVSSQQRGASRTSQRPWPGRLLTYGSTGWEVAYVQRLLGLPTSGFFGARTLQAVYGFQRMQRLVADGIVGPMTWSALVRART